MRTAHLLRRVVPLSPRNTPRSRRKIERAAGCVGADPIGALAENGFLKKPPETYYDEMADSVRFAEKNAPALRTVLADANVWANAGATP